MRKIFAIVFILALNSMLFADRTVSEGNSYSEFPFIIFVGQLVEITPFSVIFENTLKETTATTEQISAMINVFEKDTDFRSHGMASAMHAANVKDGKMRLSFYLDNITKIFSDDASTYVRYVPLFHLFEHNINSVMLTPEQIEEVKKIAKDYFLDIPLTKELIKNSWLAGVFTINPQNGKLVYKSARFFKNFEELEQSDWAHSYRIPDIVKAGLTVSMTKAIYVGHESENKKKEDSKGAKKNGGKGGKQFDNDRRAPTGREK